MNQTNKRTVLAYTENGWIIVCPISFIIFFGIMTFSLSDEKLYIQLIGFIVGILGVLITIIMFIKYLKTPNIIVECDDSGVYLHYSKKDITYLLYKDIKKVSIEERKGYKYFKVVLIIEMKNDKYEIDTIKPKDIKKVKEYLEPKIKHKYFK